MTWESQFGSGDFYPGSSKRIEAPAVAEPADDDSASWDSSPRIYTVDGADYEFFSIGDLAAALNRKPVTIRRWEALGYIPVTNLRSPSEHVSKRHRIYTRPLVEGIVRIANEERILHEARPRIEATQFRDKVLKLFVKLSTAPLYGAVRLSEDM